MGGIYPGGGYFAEYAVATTTATVVSAVLSAVGTGVLTARGAATRAAVLTTVGVATAVFASPAGASTWFPGLTTSQRLTGAGSI